MVKGGTSTFVSLCVVNKYYSKYKLTSKSNADCKTIRRPVHYVVVMTMVVAVAAVDLREKYT